MRVSFNHGGYELYGSVVGDLVTTIDGEAYVDVTLTPNVNDTSINVYSHS